MTKMLIEMKKDLDYVFRKVRSIKTKLSTQYPTAFAEAKSKVQVLDENEEDEVMEVEILTQNDGREVPKLSSTEKKKSTDEETTVQYVTLEGNKTDSSE